MVKRSYSIKTYKILFGKSGNQCAHPDCLNEVIADGTEESDAAVLAQMCHIYAASDNGPRGKPGLTDEERNSDDNLILMCGHHHSLVDSQHAEYPAEILKEWKRTHERKYQRDTAEAIRLQERAQQFAYVTALTDEQIEQQIHEIRNGRFLRGFPAAERARTLARSVANKEFAGGSSAVRARALAWCARLLVRSDDAAIVQELLAKSRELDKTDEAEIAQAFIVAEEEGGSILARQILLGLGTPPSISAMLRIITNEKGEEKALEWAENAGLDLASFDSEGKLNFIMNEAAAGRWDAAYDHVNALTSTDYESVPLLNNVAAQAHLARVLSKDLRNLLPFQVPFESRHFPLAGTKQAMVDRRRAVAFYEKLDSVAREYRVPMAAALAADMALWLRLRDPIQHDTAFEVLRESLRDDDILLRRLPLALDFGVKVDLVAVERRISQRIALAGKGSYEEALARLALVSTQKDPGDAAKYINAHRGLLTECIARSTLVMIEVELLCQSGQVETAKAVLSKSADLHFTEHEHGRLQRMIAEAEGANPAAERRMLYEKTGNIRDLVALVGCLEQKGMWQELAPPARALFELTRSSDDAIRVAKSLSRSGKPRDALQFLEAIPDIVVQEDELQSLYAWALYQDGQLNLASQVLEPLRHKRDAVNDSELFINLAIASGHWDRLVDHTTREWELRGQRTAERLLRAGQLAYAVSAPHAKELIIEATRVAPQDPTILAGAYFLATHAAWEDSPLVADWLMQAADKSGSDGPLKSVTMEELLQLKPNWDRRQEEAFIALKAGEITVSGAAYLMNQSMSEICLRAAANRSEADVRRRALIFAFSGARPPYCRFAASRLALDLTAIFTFAQLGILGEVVKHFDRVLIPDQLLVWLFQEHRRISFHQPSQIRDARDIKSLVDLGVLRVLGPAAPGNVGLAQDVGFDLAAMLETATKSEQDAYVVRSSPVRRLRSLTDENVDLSEYDRHLCSCQGLVDAMRASMTAPEAKRAHSYLRLREERWPNEANIRRGAVLYLDDLAVTYLKAAGVLEKLSGAGYTVYISKTLEEHGNRLMRYESVANAQLSEVETIRAILSSGLDDGRIELVPSDEQDRDDTPLQAQLNFLSSDKIIDAAVIDDRFVNRFLHMTRSTGDTPIVTSLDVVEHLIETGRISAEDGHEYRTSLRRSGYTFVPVLDDELTSYLLDAPVHDDLLVETAELRAIRESALLLRLREVLQAPSELAWLTQYKAALLHAVRTVWDTEADAVIAQARCEWVLGQFDTRGWASVVEPGAVTAFVIDSHAAMLHALCFASDSTSKRTDHAFHRWIENRILKPIKETEPEIFERLVLLAGRLLDDVLNRYPSNGSD